VDLAGLTASMREAGVEDAVPAMLVVFVQDASERLTTLEAGRAALHRRDGGICRPIVPARTMA
jgi:hypothetical protein